MPQNAGFTTIDRYIHLPAAGSASDRFRPGQPLSAGSTQILCSNIELLRRENSLCTWWEHPGQSNISGTLGFGVNEGAGTRPDEFPWDDDPADTNAAWVAIVGPRRVRPYGSTGLLPRLRLSGYASCGSPSTAGVILVARQGFGRPTSADPFAHTTVTSSSLAAFDCVIDLQPGALSTRHVAPLDERTSPAPPPAESGTLTEIVAYIGVYTTSAGNKAAVRGLSLYLDVPAGY